MTKNAKVLWSEGMLLQPQHLQQQERYWHYQLTQRPQSLEYYQWGITELKIDQQLLLLGKFAITAARGILPDGTAFAIPAHDKAPQVIDIPLGVTNCKIYLALSLTDINEVTSSSQTTTSDQPRFRGEIIDIPDNNAGFGYIAPVQLGNLCLRVMLATEDRQGYSCLAIACIAEALANHQVILSDQFIPACLNIHAVPKLLSFLQEIYSLLQYRGDLLVERINGDSANAVVEMNDLLLLQIINRFAPLFAHYQHIQGIHPEQLYRLLIEFTGELATLTHPSRRPIAIPPYVHDDLETIFKPLMFEVRRALSVVLAESAVAIKLEMQAGNIWTAIINNKELLQQAQFILAVQAQIPLEQLRTLLPAHLKIATTEEIRNLVNRALPGVDIQMLTTVPRQIPFYANYSYFILNKAHPLWQSIAKTAGIALHISGHFPGLILQLWAVKETS